MTIQQRLKSPTPSFFKSVRKVGLAVASIGAVLLSAPVALPPVITQAGGYLVVAGGVASTVSQLATGGEKTKNKKHGEPAE